MRPSLIWVTHSLLSETLKSIKYINALEQRHLQHGNIENTLQYVAPQTKDLSTNFKLMRSKAWWLFAKDHVCQIPELWRTNVHGFLQNHPPSFGQLHFSAGGSIDQKTSPEIRLCRFLALQDTTLSFSKSLSWTTVFEELFIEQHHCVSLVRSSNSRSHPAMTVTVCNANYDHAVSQYLPRNQCYPRQISGCFVLGCYIR